MHKRFITLVVALAGAALWAGGCATVDKTSAAGSNPETSNCRGVIDPRTGVCIGG